MKTTLEKAFTAALNKRGLLTSLGYTKHQVSNLKRNHKARKVSVEMMREVVTTCGYKCIQKELWVLQKLS